ncbi:MULTISPECIES: antibiotic biosynthesis monooxygenase family protein [Neobacillus]|uniref:Antibiotic biosynthesis monooxygenase n=1 Tax=Neobacillus citreus TaxID=2833578 RepID=A0A942YC05_9BACI|nr:antibiotic biosynthesis monooxygenase family protein [Neobacillus citreus]MCH6264456.1 antibiotic biosynthesis monooxygenase [Neobacillus citreus]
MVQEIMLIDVKPGTEQEFENAFKKAAVIVSSAKGCLGYELHRCMEQENKYLVFIKWETVEDHVTGFKNSTDYQEMKSLIGPYYLHVPHAGHYEKVD